MTETPGDVIKRWRSTRGRISQEVLAERIRANGYKLSMSMVSSIERNKDKPSRDTALAIDTALDAGGEIVAAFGFAAEGGDLASRLAAVEAVVQAQGRAVRALIRETRGRLDDGDELAARLDALERVLVQQQAR